MEQLRERVRQLADAPYLPEAVKSCRDYMKKYNMQMI